MPFREQIACGELSSAWSSYAKPNWIGEDSTTAEEHAVASQALECGQTSRLAAHGKGNGAMHHGLN